ncbi:hypothetical protein SAMN05660766_0595 [Curtobacterium sp. 314Chir4.1]|uniref:hypothetical protein n=1 Tax=Curtobacterium sp. 314Chir4.1 TaxID=1279028 RepID=UPI000BD38183|nr:hypothetical protein [Curtobacterium sp. 314Chir4.1]SOC86931.1 hypothetical protein SAMN05660766_0595 [Curtobacterium sp. 314Chir4.1]
MTFDLLLPSTGVSLLSQLENALAPERSEELWYHDRETNAQWERLAGLQQAEDVVRSRTPKNPWAGIGRFSAMNQNGEFEQVHLFEVLGWADRVYVCGDVSRTASQWRWSSWPVDALRRELTCGTVGPAWYQAAVYEQRVVTVNDALTQLRPALHAIEQVQEQVRGYIWLPRENDLAPNEHLRVPL